jgi:hypothetical protein
MITDEDRECIAKIARGKEGQNYGYIKAVVLQLFDQIFWTNFFTRTFSITNKVYCSQMWAQIYYDVTGVLINGVQPESCEPDDWQDEVLKHPDKWVIIQKGEK